MLHLWGRLSSINVRKVVWCAHELGLQLARTDAGGAHGIVGTDAFRQRNPNAMVPLLQDGAFFLWESNVIVRYLSDRQAASHGTRSALLPPNPQGRFEAEQWMDWQQTTLNPAGRDAFVQLIRKPGGQTDAARVTTSVAATEPLWDLLDQHLRDRAYLCGDAFTMADIPVGCELHRWRGLGLPPGRPRPALDGYWQRLLARPAAQPVLHLPLS